MKANEIIREIMKLKEVRPTVLSARLNIKKNVLSQRLTQTNISIDKMNEMLRVLDYKSMVVPRETKVPEGGFEVEGVD